MQYLRVESLQIDYQRSRILRRRIADFTSCRGDVCPIRLLQACARAVEAPLLGQLSLITKGRASNLNKQPEIRSTRGKVVQFHGVQGCAFARSDAA